MKRSSALLVVAALFLGGLLLLPASRVPAAEKMDEVGKVDMEKMISSAKTRADHEALAADFEKEATEAKAKAAEHRKTAESYKQLGGSAVGKLHLDEHCERLAKSYERAAMEYEMLAKAHRQMAKEAK